MNAPAAVTAGHALVVPGARASVMRRIVAQHLGAAYRDNPPEPNGISPMRAAVGPADHRLTAHRPGDSDVTRRAATPGWSPGHRVRPRAGRMFLPGRRAAAVAIVRGSVADRDRRRLDD